MPLENNIVGWYVKNIIIPNFVLYDKPAYVVTEQTTPYGHTFQRDVFLSEILLAQLETEIVKALPERGKILLYGVGKNFGWNYGKSFRVPTVERFSNKEIIASANFLSNFVGGTWAEKSVIKQISVERKYFEIEFNNYVICSKNGIGSMLTEGGICGLWAWMVNDYSVEGIHTKCEGRKENVCKTICGSVSDLSNFSNNLLQFSNKVEFNTDTEEYRQYNRVRQPRYTSNSMKKMITNGIVKYYKGKMEYNNERYFPLGIDFIYLIETEFGKIDKCNEILFSVSKENGKRIISKEKNISINFVSDFLASQGWGEFIITGKSGEYGIDYYPWHPSFNEASKLFLLGLISGFLSIVHGKEVSLSIASTSNRNGYISILLREKNEQ